MQVLNVNSLLAELLRKAYLLLTNIDTAYLININEKYIIYFLGLKFILVVGLMSFSVI